MKKLILSVLFIFCLSFQASAWNPMVVVSGGGADPCVTAGCTGTYEFCGTFEYSGDTDQACVNSGAGTAQGTVSGATIQEASALAGTYGVLLDADGEYIEYSITPTAGLKDEGWIVFSFETPDPLQPTSDQSYLARLVYDGTNEILIYVHATTDAILASYEGDGGVAQLPPNQSVAAGTTYTYAYTWENDGTDRHATCIQTGVLTPTAMFAACSGSWGVEAEDLPAWADEPATFNVGDRGNGGVDGAYNVDDYRIGNTYEGD